MSLYVIVAGLIFILHLIYESTKSEKIRAWLWYISCFMILFLTAMRSYNTGSDTIQYVNLFESMHNTDWTDVLNNEHRDPGFVIFTKLVSMITTHPTVFLAITTIMSYAGVFDLIKRNSERPVLALYFTVTLGNFMFNFTGMRQAIAMSFCMFAVRFMQEKKPIRFLALVLVAAVFHHSAYIFLPMYIIAHRKVNIPSLIVSVGVTFAAMLSYERLLGAANDILGYDYGVEYTGNGFIFFMIILFVVGLAFLNKERWVTDEKQIVIMNMGIMCAVLWTFRLLGRTAERPSMYWLNVLPIVLTNATYTLKREEEKKFVMFASAALAFLLFYTRSGAMYYRFFWQ